MSVDLQALVQHERLIDALQASMDCERRALGALFGCLDEPEVAKKKAGPSSIGSEFRFHLMGMLAGHLQLGVKKQQNISHQLVYQVKPKVFDPSTSTAADYHAQLTQIHLAVCKTRKWQALEGTWTPRFSSGMIYAKRQEDGKTAIITCSENLRHVKDWPAHDARLLAAIALGKLRDDIEASDADFNLLISYTRERGPQVDVFRRAPSSEHRHITLWFDTYQDAARDAHGDEEATAKLIKDSRRNMASLRCARCQVRAAGMCGPPIKETGI